ncbi:zinc-dependent alcohol dehydrogenase family protein [Maritalea myrionectae]|uniref:zinc-dependent alcohol dehydrogenase family protein n=1 Tax=Maritalea myrionectae TaxID=454601 RepID=UPI00040759B2|nr:zinc-dependent alcohol dehydrogenase family protein [Maritalea myrionectae]
MKTIEITEIGNPADVLMLKETPTPTVKPGEVRVEVLATPIHPSNLLSIAGQYGEKPQLHSVPGVEGVGRVVELGEGVTHLEAGQNVLLAGGLGTWRDEMVGPADGFIPLPPGDVEQLSMVALNPVTAHLLLTKFRTLKPGDWIIQSAANSAVGELIIQLAAQRGIKTVNIVRRESLIPALKALGADIVLVDQEDLAERVKEATGGAPIVYGIDCVGDETFVRILDVLAYGGTLTTYGALSMRSPALNLGAAIFKEISIHGFWSAKWFETASPAERQDVFGTLIPMVANGKLKTKIDSRFPLEEIGQAADRAAEAGRDGKVLLVPN